MMRNACQGSGHLILGSGCTCQDIGNRSDPIWWTHLARFGGRTLGSSGVTVGGHQSLHGHREAPEIKFIELNSYAAGIDAVLDADFVPSIPLTDLKKMASVSNTTP